MKNNNALLGGWSLALLAAGAMLSVAAGYARAQDYPNKPVRVIVGFTPGGVVDITGRLLAAGMQRQWGQPVIVENKPGAGGSISAEYVAKQVPADGYVLVITPPAIPLYTIFEKELRYDPIKDLNHISVMVEGHLVMWTNMQQPFTNFKDMIAYAKANPGKLNVGVPGLQSSVTINFEGMKQRLGVDIVIIPTKGTAETRALVASNQIQLGHNDIGTVTQELQAGHARVLAVTGKRRNPAFPDAPTFAEIGSGLDEIFIPFWLGLAAPAATPAVVISKISSATTAILQSSEAKDALGKAGMEVLALDPQASQQRIAAEGAIYSAIAKRAGMK